MKTLITGAVAACVLLLFSACTRVLVQIQQEPTSQTSTPTPHQKPLTETKKFLREIPELDPLKLRMELTPYIHLVRHNGLSFCPTKGRSLQPITQETDSGCWIASAKAVMEFHDVNVSQCNIATRAGIVGEEQKDCCKPENKAEIECSRNGLPEEVFDAFAFQWEKFEGALSPEQLTWQICKIGPVISLILYAGGGGHTFVVRDWEYTDQETSVWVNDHLCKSRDSNGLCESPSSYALWSFEDYLNGNPNGYKNDTHSVSYVCLGEKCQP